MKSDAQLKRDVSMELEWDPAIDAAHVGVQAQDGVITLTGHLDTYAEKHAVERAALRVEGVRAVAVELDVKLAPDHRRSDAEIAAAAETAFEWNTMIPAERIRVKVEKGWVTLSGELEWEYQRRAADKAVRALTGVVGVSNGITLAPRVVPSDVEQRIREALARRVAGEARHIEVSASGSTVTLRGQVDSWAERAAAQGAAWSAPGVSLVVNNLSIGGGR